MTMEPSLDYTKHIALRVECHMILYNSMYYTW